MNELIRGVISLYKSNWTLEDKNLVPESLNKYVHWPHGFKKSSTVSIDQKKNMKI
jgi:hypothetical protein